MFSKRGLSGVIVTLVMIVLAMVAIGIIWVSISGTLESGSEDISESFGDFLIDLELQKVTIEDNGDVSVTVKRGVGKEKLTGINFVIFDGIKTEIVHKNTTLEELEIKTFSLNYSGSIKEISIAPVTESSSGEERTGSIIEKTKFVVFRYDDNERDLSRNGDGNDDGANKWINVQLSGTSKNYYLWIYGRADKCDSQAQDNFRLKVNDDLLQVINFNWCDMFGLGVGDTYISSDYEWKKFEIPSKWLIDGENKFNFYESGSACSWHCANWNIGTDTDSDEGMSAWSSNANPSCQPIRGTNPLRQGGSCYNEELMIFLKQ